ncbi:MAG: hypothetical protein PHS93_09010 [Candidatus Omnitrophica bacterium]|nr:hypothetical protein [Candidatus Omnitrophota bacterium]MDD5353284.1 hypothetical protein [Candidatus Omnitrophota bacterium]
MTNTLNRKVAEKLGIEWHEVFSIKEYLTADGYVSIYTCSCGATSKSDQELCTNPDFTANAKDLIEVLMKRDDWNKFRGEILEGNHLRIIDRTDSIYKYILNPRLLCEAFLEWEG